MFSFRLRAFVWSMNSILVKRAVLTVFIVEEIKPYATEQLTIISPEGLCMFNELDTSKTCSVNSIDIGGNKTVCHRAVYYHLV